MERTVGSPDNAAVLNGGWQKWSRENRPSETGSAQTRAPGTITVKPPRNLMAGKAEVKAAIGDGAICTLNALAPDQHKGSGGNAYGRPGRIAGSANVPAGHLLDPATNTFLSADELRFKFDAVGAMDRVAQYARDGWPCEQQEGRGRSVL